MCIFIFIFIDKPGKGRDFYHSCYALSGLSIAQHHHNDNNTNGSGKDCYGDSGNLLRRTSAVFNIGTEKLMAALAFYTHMPHTHDALLEA